MAAFHFGRLFHICIFRAGLSKPFHSFLTDLRVAQFTAAETNGYLYLVPILEESRGMPDLGVEIANVGIQPQTNFLDFHNMLIFLGFLFPLCLLKPIFSVIHDPAYRRDSGGSNFDQIEVLLVRDALRLSGGHNAQLAAVVIDNANLIVTDLLVDLQFLTCYG